MEQFLTESAFKSDLEKQIQRTPQTLARLKKSNITSDNELKLNYSFYTNSVDKAQQLTTELTNLNYTVQYYGSGDNAMFKITGWTTKIRMTDEIIIQWTKRMCELGYKFDCKFGGWEIEF
jgi:hypothetical protein